MVAAVLCGEDAFVVVVYELCCTIIIVETQFCSAREELRSSVLPFSVQLCIQTGSSDFRSELDLFSYVSSFLSSKLMHYKLFFHNLYALCKLESHAIAGFPFFILFLIYSFMKKVIVNLG